MNNWDLLKEIIKKRMNALTLEESRILQFVLNEMYVLEKEEE